ncbi:MAG: hypothetical protein R6V01_02830 [Thermoplasmatota archaeon]
MIEQDLTKKAEIEVVNQLRQVGWNVQNWDPEAEGAKDIEAEAAGKKILVQVQTARAPNNPPDISRPEMENLMVRAQRRNAEAYQARVRMDQNANRVGNIGWKKLI